MSQPLPQHLSTSNERYTPPEIIEPVRAALGGVINLDPASCVVANLAVKAERYYSLARGQDGLTLPWWGSVFLNPPYGKHASGTSNQLLWTKVLAAKIERREVDQAILLVNAATGDSFFKVIWRYARYVCFPFKRIRFLDETGQPLPQPPNANVLAYFGVVASLPIYHLGKIGAVVKCLNSEEIEA